MPNAYSSYGLLLKENSSGSFVNLCGIQELDPSEVSNKMIDSTTLDGGNWKTKIASNLVEAANLKATAAFTANDFTRMFSYCTSGCSVGYQISFPTGKSMSFTGLIEKFNPSKVDAKTPSLSCADVEIAISGSVVVA
jgi:hypothetical protein